MTATNPVPNPDPNLPPSPDAQEQPKVPPSQGTSNQTGSRQRYVSRIWAYLFFFLLGILLSFIFTLYLTYGRGKELFIIIQLAGLTENLTQDIRAIISILFFGGFGGLLYSLRERKMELPYISKNTFSETKENLSDNQSVSSAGEIFKGEVINLGIVADCLVGIGGALGIFLLLPINDTTDIPLFKLLATAMIGGYGGRSLLDRALDNILQKQEKLEEGQKKTEEHLKKQEEQSQKDSEIIRQLSRYLDLSLTLSYEEEQNLLGNIKTASREVRFGTIFKNAQSALYENRFNKNKPLARDVIKNTLKVFESLRDSDEDKSNDRYPAHVAYAHMALEEWQEAITQLDIAKAMLKNSQRGEKKRDELVYESNRVICKLKLGGEKDVTENLELLKALSNEFNALKEPFTQGATSLWDRVDELLSRSEQSSDIYEWLQKNKGIPEVEQWLKESGNELPESDDKSGDGSNASKNQSLSEESQPH